MALFLAGTASIPACQGADAPPNPVPQTDPVGEEASGPLQQDHIRFRFSVSYEAKPDLKPLAELDRLLTESESPARRVESIVGNETSVAVVATIREPVAARIMLDPKTPASRISFVDPEDRLAAKNADEECVLEWSYPGRHPEVGLRTAIEITQQFASSVDGIIGDETTRQFFSVEKWRERRNTRWSDGVPNLGQHVVIHIATRKDGLLVAITHGMEKFGLPDIVVRRFPSSAERQIEVMINLFAQGMAEGLITEVRRELDLDMRRIHHPDLRDYVANGLEDGATQLLRLSVIGPSDASGRRLLGIFFERGAGPDELAQQADVLTEAFGSGDESSSTPNDAELQAASQKAHVHFVKLRDRFQDGIPVGESLHVKAPAETSDGELVWLWVSVSSWHDDLIEGTLVRDPKNVPDLRAGDMVEVNEEDVFDFLHRRLDGSYEGNTTGAMIRSRKSSDVSE